MRPTLPRAVSVVLLTTVLVMTAAAAVPDSVAGHAAALSAGPLPGVLLLGAALGASLPESGTLILLAASCLATARAIRGARRQ